MNHVLEHKASLNKNKKIEIVSCIPPDHNGIKLELNRKRNYRDYLNTWRWSTKLLSGSLNK
jgi:hypothetical protein